MAYMKIVPSKGQKELEEWLKENQKYINTHGSSMRLISHISPPKVGLGYIWVPCDEKEFEEILELNLALSQDNDTSILRKNKENERFLKWSEEAKKRRLTVKQTIIKSIEEARMLPMTNLEPLQLKTSIFYKIMFYIKAKLHFK